MLLYKEDSPLLMPKVCLETDLNYILMVQLRLFFIFYKNPLIIFFQVRTDLSLRFRFCRQLCLLQSSQPPRGDTYQTRFHGQFQSCHRYNSISRAYDIVNFFCSHWDIFNSIVSLNKCHSFFTTYDKNRIRI
jgi:hypothetical protein